jgi:RNA polymerase sigma factor (sigma-70 family)
MEKIYSFTEFTDNFENNRSLYQRLACSYLDDIHKSDDAIQEAYLRIYKHVQEGKSFSNLKSYTIVTIKNICIDILRKESSQKTVELLDTKLYENNPTYDPFLIDEDTLTFLSQDLPSQQKQDFFKHFIQEIDYSEIALESNRSEAAVRQSYKSAKDTLFAKLILNWIINQDYSKLNIPRITLQQSRLISALCRKNNISEHLLFDVFAYKGLNRAIQNITWILSCFYNRNDHKFLKVTNFLSEQLTKGDLYRGNKSYIAEALIDLDYRRYIQIVRKDFILPIEDLEDRVTMVNLDNETQKEVGGPCIYDVKKVHPIGGQIPTRELLDLQTRFLAGKGSIDARRCMAFQLLRSHTNDGQYVKNVILNLHQEMDQTNAYYIVKYLKNWGMKEHPGIIDREIIHAVRSTIDRWPENKFFLDTYKYFDKLKYKR